MDTIICIATRNRNKVREISDILELPAEFTLTDLTTHPEIPDITEDGTTYIQNAMKKAVTVAQLISQITIADDSGLEVDQLNGFPGIHSARYLGEHATDRDRCSDVLAKLSEVPEADRGAKFVCAAVMVIPGKNTVAVQKSVAGIIARKPAGISGFGYDPIFYLPDHGCTMAELSLQEKNRISHRALAFRALRPYL